MQFTVTLAELKSKQSRPLAEKIEMSQCVIETWWKHWDSRVYVAFSGGKDSTVLLDVVRNLFPDTIAVYSDTGLEYPELKEHVKSYPNVKIVRPKLSYRQVVDKYGYAVGSKLVARFVRDIRHASEKNKNVVNLHLTGYNRKGEYVPSMKLAAKWMKLVDAPFEVSEKCCQILKKNPMQDFGKRTGLKPYTGMMASDSKLRERDYLNHGCSLYTAKHPICNPLSFWTEQDIFEYIVQRNLRIPSVYGQIIKDDNGKWKTTGVKRTGCVWCLFGVHLEKGPNRFQQLKITHPKIYEYAIKDMGLGAVLDYIGVEY
jgi:3'-phosphoadenosine 5'-phosphosulfate sulfotransferase (PAPS reductase)/FAD synthetase